MPVAHPAERHEALRPVVGGGAGGRRRGDGAEEVRDGAGAPPGTVVAADDDDVELVHQAADVLRLQLVPAGAARVRPVHAARRLHHDALLARVDRAVQGRHAVRPVGRVGRLQTATDGYRWLQTATCQSPGREPRSSPCKTPGAPSHTKDTTGNWRELYSVFKRPVQDSFSLLIWITIKFHFLKKISGSQIIL